MLLSFLYLLLAVAIVTYELSRKKRMLLDQLSIATIFYLANIVIPALLIHFILETGLVKIDDITTFPVLNYIYHSVQSIDKWIVLFGTTLAYCGLALGYKLCTARVDFSHQTSRSVNSRLCLTWIIVGIVFVMLMLVFGNSLAPGNPIKGLLLSTFFRAEDPFYAFERNALNANIYVATHTFLLISVLGYALWDEKRRGRFVFLALTVFFLMIDVVASGARRNLLIAAIFIYMYVANRSGKYKIYYMFPVLVMSVPLLYFGKLILRNLSNFDVGMILGFDVPLLQQVLVAACELGFSHVESLGTLALYNDFPRFGLDHLFSVLRMIPFGTFGLEKPFPLRMVRISTEYLIGDPSAQDIPPGYIGQCWIDFPYIGFFIIPLLHGIVFALVERGFKSVDLPKSPFYLMVYLVVGYIVALPLNNGTLDFVCSPDIVLALLLILLLHVANGRARTGVSELA